uniref:Uncharacterized protein n=1 Tax=Populus davidiana TaxID=266767 RepID=A0A6M2FB57_9ROSI
MAVQNVRETLTLSASTIRIVQSEHPYAKTIKVVLIVALGYNWHSRAQTSTLPHSTHGTKWKTFDSTPFMVFTQISRILSPVSIARSSNCDLMVCRVLVSSYAVIFSSSLFQMVQTFLFQLMPLFVASLQSCAV